MLDMLCRYCKWYTPLCSVDSGLQSGRTYVIGRCDNAQSALSGWDNLADWVSCWLWTQTQETQKVDKEVVDLVSAARRVRQKYGTDDNGNPLDWSEWLDLAEACDAIDRIIGVRAGHAVQRMTFEQ